MSNSKRLEEAYQLVYRASERFVSGQMDLEEYESFIKGFTILVELRAAMSGEQKSPSLTAVAKE